MRGLTIAVGMVMALGAAVDAQTLAKIQVMAGQTDRQNTPVWVELGDPLAAQVAAGVRLQEAGKAVAAQLSVDKPARLCWILSGTTKAGATRTFELVKGPTPAGFEPVKLVKDDKSLEVIIGDRKVLRYNYAIVPPPEGKSPLYNRGGFIHPLWSPDQAVLTGIHAADHTHHMGFWMPWTHSVFEGRDVDFWNICDGKGTVRFKEFVDQQAGPVFGRFRVRQDHIDLKAPGGEKVALNEVWDVLVWNTGDSGAWVWDFTSTQRCASNSPLQLPAYRYGGVGFRGTPEWKEGLADYLTSEGKTRKDGHGTRAKWCMMFGPTTKGPEGIVFMGHPSNHEFPEPMRLWPEGDIFFNFCPVQQKDWVLEPGKDYVFRYRLYVYNGQRRAEQAEQVWQDFGNPPVVTITSERQG
jgi:hypothetical protein